MPGMATRRVGATGQDAASLTMTLPRDWCAGNKVERGARVTVIYDDALVVLPPGAPEEAAWSLLRAFRRVTERGVKPRSVDPGPEIFGNPGGSP
jgi:hypothetical protein